MDKPFIKQAKIIIAHGGPYAPTAVMTANNNVLDLRMSTEYCNTLKTFKSVGNTRLAMLRCTKNLTRKRAGNLVGGYAAIAAAYP